MKREMFNIHIPELSIGITCDRAVYNTSRNCIEFWIKGEPMFRVYEDNPNFQDFEYYTTEDI